MKRLFTFIIFSMLATGLMAQPISQLPAATTVSGADFTVIVQSGVTKKAALSKLLTYITNNYPLDSLLRVSILGDSSIVVCNVAVCDTLDVSLFSHWREDGDDIENTNTGKVILPKDSTYFSGILDEANKVYRIVHQNQYGKVEYTSPYALHLQQKDTLLDLKEYGYEDILTVGALQESYSDFSTAVAAAGTGDVIHVSNSTLTESGTVTMPANSTLKIYEGGLLTGTFTLVGNNTRLDAGLYKCFDDNVTLSGTWIVDKVYPEWFGMDGDADESDEFQKTIDFTGLTSGKTIVFQNRNYYLESGGELCTTDLTIEGGGASLHSTYNAATGHVILTITGSIDTYDTLAVNASAGVYHITLPVGAGLLSAVKGDLVKIISDEDLSVGNLAGELKRVDRLIGSKLFFTEPLYATYLTSDVVRAAKINAVTANIQDLNIVGDGYDNGFGIFLYYTDNSVVRDVTIENTTYAAILVKNSYAPTFDVITHETDMAGVGYGVDIGGAVTNSVTTIRSFYNRHAVAHGGDGAAGGVPWNSLVINSIATSALTAHCYDAHPGTGSVTWENCKAIGGLLITDTTLFMGEWDSGTTYANDEIVSVNGFLLQSRAGGNLNHDPSAATGYTYWDAYDNGKTGFLALSDNVTIKDCEVLGMNYGLGVGNSVNNFTVDGFKATNVNFPMSVSLGQTLTNATFDNIVNFNEVYCNDGTVLTIPITARLYNVNFGKLTAVNNNGINIISSQPEIYLNVSELNISGGGWGLLSHNGSGKKYFNINSFINDGAYVGYNIGIVDSVEQLKIGEFAIKDLNVRGILVDNDVKNLQIDKINVTYGTSVTGIIIVEDTVESLVIGDAYAFGTATYPLVNNTSVISHFSLGTASGDISAIYTGTAPANYNISGLASAPFFKWNGTQVVANKPLMMYSSNYLYFNTTDYYIGGQSNLMIYEAPAIHAFRIGGAYRYYMQPDYFFPTVTLARDLGTPNYKWQELYTMNITDTIGVTRFAANVTVSGQLTNGNSFAELFEDASNVTATVATYRTIVSLQSGQSNAATLTDSTMTLTQAGTYLINYSASFTHAVNSTVCHISLFVNNSEDTSVEAERKIGTGGDYGSMAATGLITVTANAVLKLKAKADNNGDLTVNHLNFNATRIK